MFAGIVAIYPRGTHTHARPRTYRFLQSLLIKYGMRFTQTENRMDTTFIDDPFCFFAASSNICTGTRQTVYSGTYLIYEIRFRNQQLWMFVLNVIPFVNRKSCTNLKYVQFVNLLLLFAVWSVGSFAQHTEVASTWIIISSFSLLALNQSSRPRSISPLEFHGPKRCNCKKRNGQCKRFYIPSPSLPLPSCSLPTPIDRQTWLVRKKVVTRDLAWN